MLTNRNRVVSTRTRGSALATCFYVSLTIANSACAWVVPSTLHQSRPRFSSLCSAKTFKTRSAQLDLMKVSCSQQGSEKNDGQTNKNDRRQFLQYGVVGAGLLALGWEGKESMAFLLSDRDSTVASDSALTPSEKGTISLFKEATPSVVFINTFLARQGAFSMDVDEMAAGTGSGFVWDNQGHIVTNYHVIRGANAAQVAVTGKDGKQTVYRASLSGVDPDKDIAVLQIDAPTSSLQPIKVGNSKALQVGQMALAIGNPFGLDHTLTTGVISGLGRETKSPTGRPIRNVIQTDAAINPGNSGGALLNSQGKLIGMNTAIFSPSGASAGIGFAIPVDTVKVVVDRLIKFGQTIRPVLGITFLESEQAKQLGLPEGVLVLTAPRGSPAEQSGIKSTTRTLRGIELGDIIVGVNDEVVKDEADLFAVLETYKPGDTVQIQILRLTQKGSESVSMPVTLGSSEVKAASATR